MRSLGTRHAIAVITRDRMRANRPTVLLLVGGQPFAPLASYFRQRNVSLSTETTIARSVALLIDFIIERGQDFLQLSKRRELYNSLIHDVRYGTIAEAGDATGLWWLPRNLENVESIANSVCEFSDWLVENHEAAPLNGYRQASVAEQINFWRRWNIVRYSSLMAHVKSATHSAGRAQFTRTFVLPERPLTVTERAPSFPIERFSDLLNDGFRRSHPRGQDIWFSTAFATSWSHCCSMAEALE